MSAEEVREIVRSFGGFRRTARVVGYTATHLGALCRGQWPVTPLAAAALREAAERRARSEPEDQIALAVAARVARVLALLKPSRHYRTRSQIAGCVDRLMAVLKSNGAPMSFGELCQTLGACRSSLSAPLLTALKRGWVERVGVRGPNVRYRATGRHVVAAAVDSVWHAQPLAMSAKRTVGSIRKDAERVAVLLAEGGPLLRGEIRVALGIPDNQTVTTLQHAERAGLVARAVHNGRKVFIAGPATTKERSDVVEAALPAELPAANTARGRERPRASRAPHRRSIR
jgi:hypothetical protein